MAVLMFADHRALAPYETRARDVRTTDIIRTTDKGVALEVDVVHHAILSPGRWRIPIVRYDGWELVDGERTRRVEGGWAQWDDDPVTVVGTTRRLRASLLDAVENARIFGATYPY